MRIGFDLTWMIHENSYGGVFQYATGLITALITHSNADVVAIISPEGRGIFDPLADRPNLRIIVHNHPKPFTEILSDESIDVLHTPIQRHLNYSLALPMICTLHDLQHVHYPEFFSQEEVKSRDIHYRRSAQFSERVIASFPFVKQDIASLFHISPDKIDVCPIGMPERKQIDHAKLAAVAQKYGLADKYLLYAANTWPHKNHIGLIRALRMVHEKLGVRIPLVCTGYLYESHYAEIRRVIEEEALQDAVVFTGYLSEEDLLVLLSHSSLVVIPTFYEAGCIPLYEAMIYEVPVICSNVTHLPETIGDARFVFNPHDSWAIADKIIEMLRDDVLIQSNIQNSREMVKRRTWADAIPTYLRSYEKAVADFAVKKTAPFFSDWALNFDYLIGHELVEVKNRLDAAESDRAARLEVINKLDRQLSECEADRAARLEVITRLNNEIEAVTQNLTESEADRAARLEVIQKLQAQVAEAEAALSEKTAHLRDEESKLALYAEELRAIYSSRSWRITEPLRALGRIARPRSTK